MPTQTAKVSANPQCAPATNDFQYYAASPSAQACQTHPADTPCKPPARSEKTHIGSPHSTSTTPPSSAATVESAHPPSPSAAAKPSPRPPETSPRTAPSIPTALGRDPQP